MRIPRKQSLVNETYQVLRESIETGQWQKTLPGERFLCEQYLISRPTLRQALTRLEEEGIIVNVPGKYRSITGCSLGPRNVRKRFRIGLLCPTPMQEMIGCTSRKVAYIGDFFHRQGMSFEVFIRARCYNASPQRSLARLVEENPMDCWILQQTNQKMQLWFEENKVPTVITGTRFPSVNLPFVDLNNRAICRHAVGLMLARNRKKICFVRHNSNLPGDILSEEGFWEGLNGNTSAAGCILKHDNTRKNICRMIDHVLATNPGIDSFIVNESNAAFSLVSHLMQTGARIPEDYAVVCRTEAMYFKYMSPTIAFYTRPNSEMARRTVNFAISLCKNMRISNPEHLIIPDFVPGSSLG